MVEKCYAVIMAGGRGERFWPLSSQDVTKTFSSSFRQENHDSGNRGEDWPGDSPGESPDCAFSRPSPHGTAQLPEIPANNFIVEPMGRDTAACIGLASLYVEKRDHHASMVVLAADHSITGPESFATTIATASPFITSHEYITTIGIKPTRPETGYGYIELGDEISTGETSLLQGCTICRKA